MIKLEIPQETIQEAFQAHLDKILVAGNYENPVKKVLDNLLGYSAMNRKDNAIANQIIEFVNTQLSSEPFQAMLGKAIADEMAKRAVDALENKDKR